MLNHRMVRGGSGSEVPLVFMEVWAGSMTGRTLT